MTAKHMTWEFVTPAANEKEREPIQGEFFNSAESLTDLSSLIREAVQNSLDARLNPNEPVRVTFTVGHAEPGVAAKYFADLGRHAAAAIGAPTEHESCPYILVEDSNTRGLCGGTTSDTPERDQGSFYYFVWKEGASNKGAGTRGKWGIGKYAFQKNSVLRGCVLLTTPADSPEAERMMGISVLKYHTLDSQRYRPDGFLCDKVAEKIVPFTAAPIVEEFRRDWSPTRPKDEPGLSVLVPYATASVTSIAEDVLEDYFIAILSGDLSVSIRNANKPGQDIELAADTIEQWLHTATGISDTAAAKAYSRLPIVKAAIEDQADCSISVTNGWTGDEIDEATRLALLEKFDRGDTVVVEVSTEWSVRSHSPARKQTGVFTVSLRKVDQSEERAIYCREGILIPDAYNRRLKNSLGLVLVRPGSLADLLGNAEGPAHEKWSKDTEKFVAARYSGGAGVLDIVKQAPRRILEALRPPAGSLDLNALARFFPTTTPKDAAERAKDTADEGAEGPRASLQNVEATVETDASAPGTLRVTVHSRQEEAHVKVGYRSGRLGKLRWSERDFVLVSGPAAKSGAPQIVVEVEQGALGGSMEDAFVKNTFVVKPGPNGEDPVLLLKGFDPHRVVMLDVNRASQ